MVYCIKCNKEFQTLQGKNNHEKWCDGAGTGLDKKKKEFTCPKCRFVIKASILNHVNSCDGRGPRSIRRKLYPGVKGWKLGVSLSRDHIEKIRKSNTGKECSKETRLKLSKKAKENKSGGKTKGGGRGKSGWYKGYWCDSSWELAYVIYNLDHNIEFERNKKGFEYIFEDKTYKFYPDFLIGNEYIEIKGWMDEKNKSKISQFGGKLKVLFRKDLKEIFRYVEMTYGKDFIKLYGE